MIRAAIADNDSYLRPFAQDIVNRVMYALNREQNITGGKSLCDFATGYLYYGLHHSLNGWIFRDYLPNATSVYLIGDFSNWEKQEKYKLNRLDNGVWEGCFEESAMKHGDLYRMLVEWKETSKACQTERIPSYVRRAVQDELTKVFSAQVWNPQDTYQWKNEYQVSYEAPIIYESHVGMATEEYRVGTFEEFRTKLLPYIKAAGYNTIQLMAIQEHPYYGSFGYHVSNFYAVSSRFGTPEELKALIDDAHGMGLRVIMDLVHSHAVKNDAEGLGNIDGSRDLYFHENEKRRAHPAWDSLCFDYGKNHVLHFLLSNCKYWMEEYKIDGFRFDGITSMLYTHHGLNRDFTSYDMYFDGTEDKDAIAYLILANRLIHTLNPQAITIAEEMSGMPGVAARIEDGGYGFDYRLAMGTPDYWIKIIKELKDTQWDMGNIYYELGRKRADEKTISYCESHDQALVGDKTLFFRLVDAAIYDQMAEADQSLIVDRGIALHKMIRLMTYALAGNGYLCFMGNEFGHPEWIDFPREGNNWSYKHARRQWSLLTNSTLKFKYLAAFDKAMLSLGTDIFKASPELLHEDKARQIIAFKRNELYFIFNFSPDLYHESYGIPTGAGKFKVVLNTDIRDFGGFNDGNVGAEIFTRSIVKERPMENRYLCVELPPRTALILRKEPTRSIYDL